jgi:hypothetical protein
MTPRMTPRHAGAALATLVLAMLLLLALAGCPSGHRVPLPDAGPPSDAGAASDAGVPVLARARPTTRP